MEKAVIFGCGQSAREYGGLIREQFEVIAYSCNRPEKWGQELNGLTILEPARIPEEYLHRHPRAYYPVFSLGGAGGPVGL